MAATRRMTNHNRCQMHPLQAQARQWHQQGEGHCSGIGQKHHHVQVHLVDINLDKNNLVVDMNLDKNNLVADTNLDTNNLEDPLPKEQEHTCPSTMLGVMPS